MCSLSSLVLVAVSCSQVPGFLFPPDTAPPGEDSDSVASYVNSTEFLAKWLEDPEHRKMVDPITDCITETIAANLMTNSPDAYHMSKYNTNVTLTTIPYTHIESQIRLKLESYFPPPDSVNFTFVKALFIPLTQPKLMYRILVVSDKFSKMSMFERHNLTTSLVSREISQLAPGYKHEQHCFVFTHDEWRRKKGNFMELYSTLFYRIPLTAEVVTFGPYGRRKKRYLPELLVT